jgi:hypothetical protein
MMSCETENLQIKQDINHQEYVKMVRPIIVELSSNLTSNDSQIKDINDVLDHLIKSNIFKNDEEAYLNFETGFKSISNSNNARIELASWQYEYISSVEEIVLRSTSQEDFSQNLFVHNNSLENLTEEDISFILLYSVLIEIEVQYLLLFKDQNNSSGRTEGIWDSIVDHFTDVGNCGIRVLEEIASSAELAAATAVATIATEGAAAAAGLAGIGLGCTVYVLIIQ